MKTTQKLSQNKIKKTKIDTGINQKIIEASINVCNEGIILLKNVDNALPLGKEKVSVFGRCQIDCFFSGYGSGGDVTSEKLISFKDAIIDSQVDYNKELMNRYIDFCSNPDNKIDKGWWAHWPSNHKEMPISEQDILKYARDSSKAIYILGRGFGEDMDVVLEKGSYYLTDEEEALISLLSEHFKDLIIILNIGSIIDLSWINKYKVKGLLLTYYLGDAGAISLVNVLNGKVNPSGKLSCSIASEYKDYPSSNNYGQKDYNYYYEDIFVGYRYFETFSPQSVIYPFGYGLSYTSFNINIDSILFNDSNNEISGSYKVQNSGSICGKTTIQLYIESPIKKLSKAKRVLVSFDKTKDLEPNEETTVNFKIGLYDFASYDEENSRYIIESGTYNLYIGEDVRSAKKVYSFNLDDDVIISQLKEVMAPEESFKVLSNSEKQYAKAKTKDLKKYIDEYIESINKKTYKDIKTNYNLNEVLQGNINIDDFISSLSVKELMDLSHGLGSMNSKLGYRGNAGIYGGITKELRDKGVPVIVCADGPSGVRVFDQVNLLPSGLTIASTFNPSIVRELYSLVAIQMSIRDVDVLLAPGMNIIRNPLCGRNFEYLSEDPFLNGKMASSIVIGIQDHTIGACPKHFACNNQEFNRTYNDSRVSERALREIYLKGFEIVVKDAKPRNIMTSYNKINGVWSHYNYELSKEILVDEWGFDGVVITDWWIRKAQSKEYPKLSNNAYRIRSCVNVLMPGNLTFKNRRYTFDKTLYNSIISKDLTMGELRQNSKIVLSFCLEKCERNKKLNRK